MKRTKLLSVFAFSALTFGMLTSCGGAKETMTDKEIVEAVMKDSSILLDNKANPMRPTTYPIAYNELTALTGGYLKATTSFTYLSDAGLEHKVSISWKYEAAQWKATEYETYTELRPVTNDIAFNGTGDFTVTGTATYNGATSTASYLIHVVNDKNYVTIKDMPTEGDVAVQGYVTGIIKDTDGKGSPYGVYVQDGEYALMIYKPSKSVTDTLEIGDAVEVLGEASSYNNVKQITGSGAVITKLSDGEIRENIAEPVIAELEDADVLNDKTHAATMYKMTGAKVISCSIDANEYNGKVTEKAYVTAVVRYKGQDITISSDRYNADYDDKQKFYDTLKEIMDSNGAKTLDYTGPIGTINVYNGKEGGNTSEKKIQGFTFIDSSFAKVNNNAYVANPNIGISAETTSVTVGKTISLTATAYDFDSEQTITWSSADPTIATVDENGTVTGVKAGTVEIKAAAASDATKFDTITITVEEAVTEFTNLDGVKITSDDVKPVLEGVADNNYTSEEKTATIDGVEFTFGKGSIGSCFEGADKFFTTELDAFMMSNKEKTAITSKAASFTNLVVTQYTTSVSSSTGKPYTNDLTVKIGSTEIKGKLLGEATVVEGVTVGEKAIYEYTYVYENTEALAGDVSLEATFSYQYIASINFTEVANAKYTIEPSDVNAVLEEKNVADNKYLNEEATFKTNNQEFTLGTAVGNSSEGAGGYFTSELPSFMLGKNGTAVTAPSISGIKEIVIKQYVTGGTFVNPWTVKIGDTELSRTDDTEKATVIEGLKTDKGKDVAYSVLVYEVPANTTGALTMTTPGYITYCGGISFVA